MKEKLTRIKHLATQLFRQDGITDWEGVEEASGEIMDLCDEITGSHDKLRTMIRNLIDGYDKVTEMMGEGKFDGIAEAVGKMELLRREAKELISGE